MIDTASFLNSKDIADYWHKIGYNDCCTPPESAFVIWKNHGRKNDGLAAADCGNY